MEQYFVRNLYNLRLSSFLAQILAFIHGRGAAPDDNFAQEYLFSLRWNRDKGRGISSFALLISSNTTRMLLQMRRGGLVRDSGRKAMNLLREALRFLQHLLHDGSDAVPKVLIFLEYQREVLSLEFK